MCGIAGFISLNQPIDHPKSHLDSALQKLKKRGPDAQGIYRDENCELGHTRLSILDTSPAANQPMTSENNRYMIIFNGEIYNFDNLRSDDPVFDSVWGCNDEEQQEKNFYEWCSMYDDTKHIKKG